MCAPNAPSFEGQVLPGCPRTKIEKIFSKYIPFEALNQAKSYNSVPFRGYIRRKLLHQETLIYFSDNLLLCYIFN
jgi:hypothetical protein